MLLHRRYGWIVAVSLLAASASQAQETPLNAGSVQIAGSASLTSSGNDDTDGRATSIGLNPQVDYFIADRFAVGATLTLGYSRFNGTSQRTVGIGPSFTYYVETESSTVYPYISAQTSLMHTGFHFDTSDTGRNAWGGGAAAGILSLFSSSVGLTTELFYRRLHQTADSFTDDSDVFGLAVGVAAFLP